MDNLWKNIRIRVVKLINVITITGCFTLVWMIFYSDRLYSSGFYEKGNWLVAGLFFLLYFFFGRISDAFLISYHRITEIVYSQTLAFLISDAVLYIVTWLLMRRLPELWPLLLMAGAQFAVSMLWSVLSHVWYFRRFRPRKTLIVYDMREGMENLIGEYGLDKKFEIGQILRTEEVIGDGMAILDGYEVVFLCGVHSRERNVILKYCVEKRITLFVIPRVGDVLMTGAKRMHMLHLPVLRVDRCQPVPEYVFLKRLTDIAFSALLLILASPLMIVVAVIIRMDGGPALYRQLRLTKDGREFMLMKFRSMRVDAERDGVARLSTGKQDDRITKIGRVIRACRIDELPQLINILKGDMSIVGPRPERPQIAEEYEKEMPEFHLRLQVKAGLTGYAQVYGKYNTTPYDKLMMDLMYIAHPSLIEDLRIIFATVKILFLPESTEGVEAGQTTAMREIAANPEK